MGERGRPPIKEIDFNELDKLIGIQATAEECASWFDVSVDTIDRRLRENFGMSFAEYSKQKKGKGKISLRRRQMQAALDGNTTMLIWLGKQYLGQSEGGEIVKQSLPPFIVNTVNESDEATE